MKMKNFLSVIATLIAASGAEAADFTLCDFEDYEIGHSFTVWNSFGDSSATTATVEADPVVAGNKVLHIVNKGWNDHVEILLPPEYAGARFADMVSRVSVKIHRAKNDPCGEWKNFQIYLGDQKLYEESWPSYGPAGRWRTWKYDVGPVDPANSSALLHLGFNSEDSDYYIDNIVLSGSDYPVYTDGKLDFSDPGSTSSAYTSYSDGIAIPSGTELNVYTSRYTYWLSPVQGSGQLNIHSGGERSYIGDNKGNLPDWSRFYGDVHIYPWPEVNPSVSAGFYGMILAHGGVKFDPGNVRGAIGEGRFTGLLAANRVILHDGAMLAGEDGNSARAHRIVHLEMEPGSRLMGYYKANKQKGVYYLVGSDGSDSELAGRIAAEGTSAVGIVKEGDGCYTISGNDNRITGFVTVVGGRVLVSNDVEAARAGALAGAVGIGANTTGVVVHSGACLGGSGSISGMADVYGHLEPGDGKGRTLTFADFQNGEAIDVRLRPSSRVIFNVYDSAAASRLDVSGCVTFSNRDENYDESEFTPVIEIRVADGVRLKKGDTFTLISAASRAADLSFRIQYPRCCTWEVTETQGEDGYALTATVADEAYSGQGDHEIVDRPQSGQPGNEAYLLDWTADYADPTPLRDYAAAAGVAIGVAVNQSKYSLSASGAKREAVAGQFNMVVAENEMKIDATEPSQGNFSLGAAWNLINFAESNGIDVRGHVLVWHQQVASWISSDGKKNDRKWTAAQLSDIMRRHIAGVAGALRGRVRQWDVVNEVLDDDQSAVWSDPQACKLRPSVWHDVIGEDFVEQAFRAAHEADPDALLFINEYGAEFMGQPKAEAYYNLVKRLVEKGVPIHGVGFQCHLNTGQVDARKLQENFRRYRDLGLLCAITELDIEQTPGAADAARLQAEDYCVLLNAALAEDNCSAVLIWGLSDPDSWRSNNPLIFDGDMKPKEAYYAVHAVLRNLAAKAGAKAVETDYRGDAPAEYFNLQGMRVNSDELHAGIYIRRQGASAEKIIVRKVKSAGF